MEKTSAPTMQDVARKAGVNRVTVSVVLNNAQASTKVSESTRARILAAAAELRYQPNAIARSLRRRRTNIIGFYSGDAFSDASNPFISQIISGLQKGCKQYRQDILLHSNFGGGSADVVYAELANGKIDGVILYTPLEDPLIQYLADSHVPTVALADALPHIPSVLVDDAAGGRLQAEYLAQKGHRHIFYQSLRRESNSVRRRVEAFCEAAAGYGMSVVKGDDMDINGGLGEIGRALLTDTSRSECPTAVVCWEDLCAYRVLGDLLAMGQRVPDDLVVMGFDGIMPPVEPLRRMTSVRAPWREVARTAVSVLLSRVEGKEVAQETVLPVELLVGNTA